METHCYCPIKSSLSRNCFVSPPQKKRKQKATKKQTNKQKEKNNLKQNIIEKTNKKKMF